LDHSVIHGSLSDPIGTGNAVDSTVAHVLVGEPDSTSPGHALAMAVLPVRFNWQSAPNARSTALLSGTRILQRFPFLLDHSVMHGSLGDQ
jgi:hypothetical protein